MSGITTGLIVGSIASQAIGAGMQAKASKGAAKTQSAAADRALALQERNYQQQRQDFSPYQQQGAAAVGRLGQMSQSPRMNFDASQPQQLGQQGSQMPQMASLGNLQGMPPQGQTGPQMSQQSAQQAPGGVQPGLRKVRAPTGETMDLDEAQAAQAVARGAQIIG